YPPTAVSIEAYYDFRNTRCAQELEQNVPGFVAPSGPVLIGACLSGSQLPAVKTLSDLEFYTMSESSASVWLPAVKFAASDSEPTPAKTALPAKPTARPAAPARPGMKPSLAERVARAEQRMAELVARTERAARAVTTERAARTMSDNRTIRIDCASFTPDD